MSTPYRQPLSASHLDYADLFRLEGNILNAVGGQQDLEQRLKGFFRASIDEVIDTARTSRLFFHELEKTEKTYLGTKFEILLRDWLQVPKGVVLDLAIDGDEVDVKSTTGGNWMIPPEAVGQLCILLKANEGTALCSFGLIRARPAYISASVNRDSKKSVTAAGKLNIWWMVKDFPYTPNFWNIVSAADRVKIFTLRGTQAIAYLFEHYQKVSVSRIQIAAIARQDDFMKRVRRNGGARDILDQKGIHLFYSETDRAVMTALGLQFGAREFMSFKPTTQSEHQILKTFGY